MGSLQLPSSSQPCGMLGSPLPGLRLGPSSVGLSGHSSGELGITAALSSDSFSFPCSCSSVGLPSSWDERDLCGQLPKAF